MNTAYIQTLYEYDHWANARVLGAASNLSPDEFLKGMGSSFGSIRDTLVHILSAQRTWLSRWRGSSPKAHLDAANFPGVEAVRAEWERLSRQLRGFLESLADERLRAVAPYTTFSGQPQSQLLWQQMAHLANHGTYHRGQVTTMLRQLGAAPIATDMIVFFRVQGATAGP
jgi:uncharacterized damage-inducible protein DinB